jgi:hypothetical protein
MTRHLIKRPGSREGSWISFAWGRRKVGAGQLVFPSSCIRRNSPAPIWKISANDIMKRWNISERTHVPPVLTFRSRKTLRDQICIDLFRGFGDPVWVEDVPVEGDV